MNSVIRNIAGFYTCDNTQRRMTSRVLLDWIANPVLSFKSKSKISELFYEEIKISQCIMLKK